MALTTLDLDAADQRRPEPRHDQYGRYLIVPPKGGKPKPYTRATTWAKALDDQGGLINWSMRMCALGLVAKKHLFAQVAAARPDDRNKLRALVEEAKDAGGGSEGSGLGNALHEFTERIDLGEDVTIPDLWRPDLSAYQNALAEHGIKVNREFVEQIVVLDSLGIAGKLDRIYTDHDGHLVIGDLKTAQELIYSRLAIAVQLAIYANAETIYDLVTEAHRPMVNVRKDIALVVHVPAGGGRAEVFEVDIEAGWKYVDLAGQVRAARALGRKENVFFHRCGTTAPDLKAVVETPPSAEPPASPELRAWISERLEAVKRDPAAVRAMKDSWPEGVPGFRTTHPHTEHELDLIATALDDVETQFSLPFTTPDPRTPPPAVPEPEPVTAPAEPPDEGPDMSPEDVAGLLQRVESLPSEQRAVLNSWAAEAHSAGRAFSVKMRPSKRRFEIYRACLELAHLVEDPDTARAAIAAVLSEAAMPAITLGSAIGALTIDEALHLTDVAIAARAAGPGLDFGPDGSVHLLNLNHPNHHESSQS